MKKTDLYKNLAHTVESRMKQAGTPDRFAQGTPSTARNSASWTKQRV